jgi:hypothetical protein
VGLKDVGTRVAIGMATSVLSVLIGCGDPPEPPLQCSTVSEGQKLGAHQSLDGDVVTFEIGYPFDVYGLRLTQGEVSGVTGGKLLDVRGPGADGAVTVRVQIDRAEVGTDGGLGGGDGGWGDGGVPPDAWVGLVSIGGSFVFGGTVSDGRVTCAVQRTFQFLVRVGVR